MNIFRILLISIGEFFIIVAAIIAGLALSGVKLVNNLIVFSIIIAIFLFFGVLLKTIAEKSK